MRPLSLTMQGINSYRTEQTIDFSELTSYGLFGIFGPTGSGKSSILDAITLALYAKLPRSTKNFININEKTASVSFLFSITTNETHRYQVDRTFRYHGKEPALTVRNVTGRLMDVTDQANPQILADRPTEVTQACISLIGLNSDDFMRTVVLPQGQFSEFLKLKNNDRRSMLQRIFHLEKYGVELTQKIRNARQQQELALSRISGELAAYEGISQEQLQETEQQLQKLHSLQKKALEACEQLRIDFGKIDALHTLQLEYEPVKNIWQSLLENQENIEKQKLQLEEGKKAEQLLPFVIQAETAAAQAAAARQSLSYCQEDLRISTAKKEQISAKREEFLESYATRLPALVHEQQQLATARDLSLSIKEYEKKITALDNDLASLRSRLTEVSSSQEIIFAKETQLTEQQAELEQKLTTLPVNPEQKQALEQGRFQEETYRTKRGLYEQKKASLHTEQERLGTLTKELSLTIDKANALLTHSYLLQNEQKARIEATQGRLSVLAKEKSDAASLMEQSQREHLASILRSNLSEGEICPVCGSTHHDFSKLQDSLTEDTSYEQHLRELKEQHTRMEEDERRLQKELESGLYESSLLEAEQHTLQSIVSSFAPDTNACPETLLDTSAPSDLTALRSMVQQISTDFASVNGQLQSRKSHYEELRAETDADYARLRSEAEAILSLRQQLHTEDFTKALAAIEEQDKQREQIRQQLQQTGKEKEALLRQKEAKLLLSHQLSGEIKTKEKEKQNYETFIREQIARMPEGMSRETDYEAALLQKERQQQHLEQEKKGLETTFQQTEQQYQLHREQVSAATTLVSQTSEQEKSTAALLASQRAALQIAPDTDIHAMILIPEEMQRIEQTIQTHEQQMQQTQDRMRYLEEKMGGQSVTEEEWQTKKEALEGAEKQNETLQQDITLTAHRQEELRQKLASKAELEKAQAEGLTRSGRIHELEQLFKGNTFIEYMAESRLRYIAVEASAILSDISGGNYALEVNEAAEFIIRDNKNGGVLRPCDTLSGGETFITSLSLALALSSALQLGGTAPLELFFLDEGFGSLDEDLLDIVMSSLEHLPNRRRSIGIITHVDAIRNRVPVKLTVTPAEEDSGSQILLEYT